MKLDNPNGKWEICIDADEHDVWAGACCRMCPTGWSKDKMDHTLQVIVRTAPG